MAQISGGIAGGGDGSFDTSNFVTDDDTRLLPDRFDGLLDVAVGQTPARFDLRVWDEVNKVWFRIPYAIWSDATALAFAYNGGSGGTALSITTTQMASGTDSVAYTSTVAATGGATFSGGQYKWTLTGSLPSGITMAPTTGNKGVSAVFSGTMGASAHTGGASGVYAITVTATDALGATASLVTSITVVAAGAVLSLATVSIPDATTSTDYTSTAIPSKVSGGTAPYAYTSTSLPNKKIHLDMFGDSIGTAGELYATTATTGQPNSTVSAMNVQVRVIDSADHNVADGVTTLSSTTVTSATANFLVGDVGKYIAMENLPGGTTITARGSATSITVSAAATASGTSQKLRVGASVAQTPTMNIISAGSSPFLDLKDLIGPAGGAYTYTSTDAARPTTVTPSYNVAQVVARAAQMAGVPGGAGRLMSSQTGTIMIGAPSGATTSTALIRGAGFNNWDLGNITFKLADTQPVNTASNAQASCLFQLSGASAPKLNFTIDGNAANQWGGSGVPSVNKSTTGSTADPIHGFYQFGVRLLDCGPATGTVVIKNVRGVTGNKSLNATGQTAVDETFYYQEWRYTPGSDIIIYCLADDGSDKSNTASGAVWQQSRSPNTSSTALIVASGVRHGFGCYAGGTLVIDTGSIFTNCGRAIGVEAGTPNTAIGATETTRVTIGSATGATNGQITTTGNDIAIGLVGNGRDATHQIGRVDIYGWDSTSDVDGIAVSGSAPTGVGVNVNNARVYTPTSGHALHYQFVSTNANFPAWAAKTTLTSCHMSTAAAWSSVTTYGSGTRVSYAGSLYKSLAGSNTNHQPDTATAWWEDIAVQPSYGLTTGTFAADL